METGILKWLNEEKGYGYIQSVSGVDIFVQLSDIISPLTQGQLVKFSIEQGPKGPIAKNVNKCSK